MVFSPEKDTKGKHKGKYLQLADAAAGLPKSTIKKAIQPRPWGSCGGTLKGMLITLIHSFNCLCQASTMCVLGSRVVREVLFLACYPSLAGEVHYSPCILLPKEPLGIYFLRM